MAISCPLPESIQFMVNLTVLDKKYHEYEAEVKRFKNKEFFCYQVIRKLFHQDNHKSIYIYIYGPNRVSKHISKKYKDKKLT